MVSYFSHELTSEGEGCISPVTEILVLRTYNVFCHVFYQHYCGKNGMGEITRLSSVVFRIFSTVHGGDMIKLVFPFI